jgi:transcriptional regulator with XRE-family HTH domain
MSTNVLIGQRLCAERQRLRLTQVELAETAHVSKTSQINYESGRRSPDAGYLAAVAAIGVDVLYVVTGRASAPLPVTSSTVTIPRLDGRAWSTSPAVNEERAAYNVDAPCVSAAWLAARQLAPAQVRSVKVVGTSMQGVLADGDLVLMDQSDTKPRSGYVYGIRQGEELLIKYCEQLPGGVLRISSANPAFAPYDVDLTKNDDFAIIGRVVASMHDW